MLTRRWFMGCLLGFIDMSIRRTHVFAPLKGRASHEEGPLSIRELVEKINFETDRNVAPLTHRTTADGGHRRTRFFEYELSNKSDVYTEVNLDFKGRFIVCNSGVVSSGWSSPERHGAGAGHMRLHERPRYRKSIINVDADQLLAYDQDAEYIYGYGRGTT